MDDNYLQTVEKALTVLKYVAEADRPIGVTEVSRALNYSKTASFRFLETLEHQRFLFKRPDGSYEIGPQAAYVGRRFKANDVVKEALLPIMSKLRDRFNLGVQLCTLSQNKVVVVEYLHSSSVIQIKSEVGTSLSLNTSAAGKLILSKMPDGEAIDFISTMQFERCTEYSICDPDAFRKEIRDVRMVGYATAKQEWAPHTFAIAVPPPYEGMEGFAIVLLAPIASIDSTPDGIRDLYRKIEETMQTF
ncbi:MAG: IclR family transcriptional regulator [Lachnospiraceae bacterium]|nr:IclR family transcriptional regulator [Lachnospiraceae bacterium]